MSRKILITMVTRYRNCPVYYTDALVSTRNMVWIVNRPEQKSEKHLPQLETVPTPEVSLCTSHNLLLDPLGTKCFQDNVLSDGLPVLKWQSSHNISSLIRSKIASRSWTLWRCQEKMPRRYERSILYCCEHWALWQLVAGSRLTSHKLDLSS